MTTRRRLRIDLRQLAVALLVAWFAALAVAAVQLERWQGELARTLLQLRADAVFRARLSSWDQVDPAWYRRKALALLGAMHKIEHDTAWTLAIPGSWAAFDDLEGRLAARMQREFGDIVLETLRRELVLRTSRLTGAPIARSNGHLRQPIDCAPPPLPTGTQAGGSGPDDVPEAVALRDWLASLRDLDAAAQAWQRLQAPQATAAGPQGASDLRALVRYALDADLPGPASRSVALFAQVRQGDGATAAALVQSLQAAVQCTLLRGVDALDQRLLARNELLATEQQLAERSAALFGHRRPEPVLQSLQHLQALHALLQQQEALLARGGNGWMRAGAPQPGDGHAALFAKARALGLLGPQAVQQAQARSAAAFAQFRQRFEALFGSGNRSALAWNEAQGRFGFSPERAALRDGLGLLLQEPLLRLDGDGALAAAPATFEEALAVADTRKRLRRELLPALPPFARAAIGRLLDARLALLAHDTAANAIRASLPQDAGGWFDAEAVRAQRAKVMQVQALLAGLGAPELAQHLASQQAGELAQRLARAQEQLAALPLLARPVDFSWWQGEPAPLLRALGVRDAAGLQALLRDQYDQLDRLGQRVGQYLALADGALLAAPATQHWQRLVQETDRYREHLPDSSMLALERYLLALGPYLKRETCVENLMAQSPPRHDDAVARRLVQLHNALLQRCLQLRTAGAAGAAP